MAKKRDCYLGTLTPIRCTSEGRPGRLLVLDRPQPCRTTSKCETAGVAKAKKRRRRRRKAA